MRQRRRHLLFEQEPRRRFCEPEDLAVAVHDRRARCSADVLEQERAADARHRFDRADASLPHAHRAHPSRDVEIRGLVRVARAFCHDFVAAVGRILVGEHAHVPACFRERLRRCARLAVERPAVDRRRRLAFVAGAERARLLVAALRRAGEERPRLPRLGHEDRSARRRVDEQRRLAAFAGVHHSRFSADSWHFVHGSWPRNNSRARAPAPCCASCAIASSHCSHSRAYWPKRGMLRSSCAP